MNTTTNFASFFEPKVRVNMECFICLKDDAPSSLKELIYSIHKQYFDDCLPSDWIYGEIYEAFVDLQENLLSDITLEADCYNHELMQWVLDNSFATSYCDEVINSVEHVKDFISIIQDAQLACKTYIYEAVESFINDQKQEAN